MLSRLPARKKQSQKNRRHPNSRLQNPTRPRKIRAQLWKNYYLNSSDARRDLCTTGRHLPQTWFAFYGAFDGTFCQELGSIARSSGHVVRMDRTAGRDCGRIAIAYCRGVARLGLMK